MTADLLKTRVIEALTRTAIGSRMLVVRRREIDHAT